VGTIGKIDGSFLNNLRFADDNVINSSTYANLTNLWTKTMNLDNAHISIGDRLSRSYNQSRKRKSNTGDKRELNK